MSAPPSLPSGWAATPGLDGGSADTPDYLFETDVDPSFRRSWGERLTFHVGGAYLLGACCLRLARLRAPTRRTLYLDGLRGCNLETIAIGPRRHSPAAAGHIRAHRRRAGGMAPPLTAAQVAHLRARGLGWRSLAPRPCSLRFPGSLIMRRAV